jgi:hypothetical protein
VHKTLPPLPGCCLLNVAGTLPAPDCLRRSSSEMRSSLSWCRPEVEGAASAAQRHPRRAACACCGCRSRLHGSTALQRLSLLRSTPVLASCRWQSKDCIAVRPGLAQKESRRKLNAQTNWQADIYAGMARISCTCVSAFACCCPRTYPFGEGAPQASVRAVPLSRGTHQQTR